MNTAGRSAFAGCRNRRRRVFGEVPQQVLREQDADDLVAILADDRETASDPISITTGRIVSGGSSRCTTTICERGTIDVAHLDLGRPASTPSSMRQHVGIDQAALLASASTSVELLEVARLAGQRFRRGAAASLRPPDPDRSSLMRGGSGLEIRILIPETAAGFPLRGCSMRRASRASTVVVAEQVQRAVHDHVRPVRRERLALLARFAGHDRRADHEVAERAGPSPLRGGRRERQHVGRPVLAADTCRFEALALGRADDADADRWPVRRSRATSAPAADWQAPRPAPTAPSAQRVSLAPGRRVANCSLDCELRSRGACRRLPSLRASVASVSRS